MTATIFDILKNVWISYETSPVILSYLYDKLESYYLLKSPANMLLYV